MQKLPILVATKWRVFLFYLSLGGKSMRKSSLNNKNLNNEDNMKTAVALSFYGHSLYDTI